MKRLILLALFFVPILANAQMIEKYNTEIKYERGDNVLRIRPFDYTEGKNRVDIMIGKSFGNFCIYGYWKSDHTGKSWIGIRGDHGWSPGRKFFIQNQLRLFKGLKNSEDQLYIISFSGYEFTDNLSAGLLGFGKFTKRKKFPSLGPSLKIGFKKVGILTGCTWDICSRTKLLLVKVSYNL